MNLPNRLTVLRILLVPVCVFLMLSESIPYNFTLSLVVFVIASITDFLDGHIARSRNLVTSFGKFLDPLADKMLVCSILICFIELDMAPVAAVLLVVFREFAVSSLRLVAATTGQVIAANRWGKAKTTTQMVAIIAILLLADYAYLLPAGVFPVICRVLMWGSAVISLVSGVIYFVVNRHCIKDC